MREIDPLFYDPHLGGDPHFCTVCKLRDDSDRSLLNYINYRAWTNYGMCEKCMWQFLGFDDGLIVNPQRSKLLRIALQRDPMLKRRMNPHLRLYLFPEQKIQYEKEQADKKRRLLRIGYTDNGKLRTCNRCGFVLVLTDSTKDRDHCHKCDHPFDLKEKFVWEV